MKRKQNKGRYDSGRMLLFSIILVFAILGGVVFSVSQKISREMSASAIQNLSESLDLMKGTIEAVLMKEAEYQKLIAQEIASIEDPKEFVRSYNRNETMVKLSLIMKGETQGVSNVEEVFSEGQLDFSAGKSIEGMPLTQSYLNYMGAWAYTIKCPVMKDGKETASLYIEYIYDTLEKSLPNGFYDGRAMLYIMDAKSERFVLKPKGMGERSAGHLNLDDFYRANNIVEKDLQEEVAECINNGKHILFYHNVRGKEALNYMWAINGGTLYLIGYVPVDAIQREGRTVNQNILIVVAVMLIAFFICCLLYYLSQRQQIKIRREQEAEREIHNKQLAEALQAAQIASHSKTMFLSNMSHDIRTPMNAIIGFTTIAVSHIDNKDQVRDCLQKVLSSSNHLLSLINDILDMSRIESGKVQIKEQECNISELMHNLVNIIQPQVKAKQLDLFIDTFEVVNEDVIADPLKLNQVFINLLSNAVKYTPAQGSISFRIQQKTTFRHGYGDYVFIIKDTGIGMASDFLQHVFEPFERESTTTRTGIEGTGLGMAITKNIVEMMNGTISVESEVGKGSTFKVSLSLKLQDVEKNAAQIKQLSGLRALVVDDDFNVCDSVSKMLGQIGMRSEWTTSGREAAYRAKKAYEEGDSYHTYIIDWQMPEMSGVETARKIRSAVGDEAPIIILTAYDWTDIEEEAKEAGVTAFCAKPLFMSDLKSALLSANNLIEKDVSDMSWTLNDFSGKRVLLVEDIELNREIAEVILTEAGFEVESAPDGTDAVEMVRRSEENYYDVILMDVQMPIMNGYEATRTIRNLSRNDVRNLPIIAMTANALEEDREAAIKNGMNAHIAKPLDIKIFMNVLSQYLQ